MEISRSQSLRCDVDLVIELPFAVGMERSDWAQERPASIPASVSQVSGANARRLRDGLQFRQQSASLLAVQHNLSIGRDIDFVIELPFAVRDAGGTQDSQNRH